MAHRFRSEGVTLQFGEVGFGNGPPPPPVCPSVQARSLNWGPRIPLIHVHQSPQPYYHSLIAKGRKFPKTGNPQMNSKC
eukprot:3829157-Amphidinium_carterae.1